MAEARAQIVTPHSYREFARVLRRAADAGRAVRVRGAGTKLGWGSAPPAGALQLSTTGLRESSFTELTATFGAGVPLARAHGLLARRGRLLALDPPLRGRGVRGVTAGDRGATGTNLSGHDAGGATLGGAIATADSGPLAHGFGPARVQVLDLLVALSDGTLAHSSETPSLDLASLLTGSYGTLGAILEVTVSTHPLPPQTITVSAACSSGAALTAAAALVADSGLAPAAIDYAWHRGRGGLLVLLAGADVGADADATAALLRAAGLADVTVRPQGDALWGDQRTAQRSAERAVVMVSGPRHQLPAVLELSDKLQATAVGRAAVALSYVTVSVNQVAALRAGLPDDCHAVVNDLPGPARGAVDPWGAVAPATLAAMRAVKDQLDPAGVCSPGVFVGGI